jgi:hypothetical protein
MVTAHQTNGVEGKHPFDDNAMRGAFLWAKHLSKRWGVECATIRQNGQVVITFTKGVQESTNV